MGRRRLNGVGRTGTDRAAAGESRGIMGQIGRRDFLVALAAAAATAGCTRLGQVAPGRAAGLKKPNVVLIFVDDLGYADLGCQGAGDLLTPHIDSLARGGVRFTNGYVTAPLCSPSRAGLMTGRYQQRFGHEFNTGNLQRQLAEDIGLPLTERTLADQLKAAGYATGLVGKWHLGAQDKFHPMRRGFDEFYGFLEGGHAYLRMDERRGGGGRIHRGTEVVQDYEYLTDAFSREAVAFIQRHRKEPFFLYLSYNAVHTPMQATQRYLDRFPDIADTKRRTMAAMLSAADDGVGEVLRALREAGVEQDTLIFFISDNGGPTGANASLNDPLRGGKGMMYEGGIRIPFIAQWPRRIPAGAVYEYPVSTLDVLPTAVAAAGAALPEGRVIDGANLIPYVRGEENTAPHEILFWRMGDGMAVRKGNWKLVQFRSTSAQLYDLSADIGETNDLSQQCPAIFKELMEDYTRWQAQTVEPLWGLLRLGRGEPARRASEAEAAAPREAPPSTAPRR